MADTLEELDLLRAMDKAKTENDLEAEVTALRDYEAFLDRRSSGPPQPPQPPQIPATQDFGGFVDPYEDVIRAGQQTPVVNYEAQQRGVDISGAPLSVRTSQSFGQDPLSYAKAKIDKHHQEPVQVRRTEKPGQYQYTEPNTGNVITFYPEVEFAQSLLQNSYGTKVEVRMAQYARGKDQRVEFKDPDNGDWVLFNPGGMDFGDLLSFSGEVPVIVGDVVGSVVGGAVGAVTGTTMAGPAGTVPGGTAGAIAGSGIGTFIGEVGRQLIGAGIRVNENTFLGIMKDAGYKAGVAGGFTAGAATVQKLARGMWNVLRGQPFNATPKELGLNDAETQEVIDTINEVLEGSGKTYRPTAGQVSTEPEMRQLEAGFRENMDLGFTSEYREIQRQNTEALIEYEARLGGTFADDAAPQEAGEAVQTVIRGQREAAAGQRLGQIDETISDAQRTIESAPDVSMERVGVILRAAAEQEQAAMNATFRPRFEEFTNGPAGELRGRARELSKLRTEYLGKTRDALAPSLLKDNARLVLEISRIKRFTSIITPGGREAIDDFAKGRVVTVKQIQNVLRDINKALIDKRKGLSAEGPDVATLKRLKGVLKAERHEILKNNGREDLSAEIQALEHQFREAKMRVDKSIIGDITRVSGGRFVIKNEDIIHQVMKKGNVTDARRLADSLERTGNMEATYAVRDAVFKMYRQAVFQKEIRGRFLPDKKLHDEFMRDYGEQLDILFTSRFQNGAGRTAARDAIDRVGGLAGVVRNQIERHQKMVKELKKSFPGKIENLDPEQIVEYVLSPKFTGRSFKLRKILQKDPEVLQAIQHQIRTRLRNDITKNGEYSHEALEKILGSRNQVKNLEMLLDSSYVKGLRMLSRATKMIQSKSGLRGGEIEPTGNVFKSVVRAVFAPPLTQRGRAFTASNQARKSAAVNALGEALQSKEAMEKFVELAKPNLKLRRVVQILSSLGGLELLTD